MIPLPQDVIRLATGAHLATVVTLMPDGIPQAQLTWIDSDGECLLVNTQPFRQRVLNVRRDPRITVLIHSADDPWDWAEVRGTVVAMIDGDEAIRHVHRLAHRYLNRDYQDPHWPQGRVILRVAADRVNTPQSVRRRTSARHQAPD
ncbi:MAG TPA: TIGR03618 family F420-dependent PPOX class oxidoreductase [Streptosporangiaceae bacterium]|nr:TIGR03618 family F420-dependent PPOX class oxidoreductase [Streptosporangiaceae bacterium]